MISAGNASRVEKSTSGGVRKGIMKVASFERVLLGRRDFEGQVLRKLFKELKDEGPRMRAYEGWNTRLLIRTTVFIIQIVVSVSMSLVGALRTMEKPAHTK